MTTEKLPDENLPARRGHIRFPDISSVRTSIRRSWCLVALRAIPGFDSV
jgi:hypothetical protein